MILPCTKAPGQIGKFSLTVKKHTHKQTQTLTNTHKHQTHTFQVHSDNDFEFYEIQKKWEHSKTVKSKFTEETAGKKRNKQK